MTTAVPRSTVPFTDVPVTQSRHSRQTLPVPPRSMSHLHHHPPPPPPRRHEMDSERDFYSPSPSHDTDLDLVFGDPPMNQPIDNTITSEQRMKLLRWLGMLGLCPRPPSYDPCTGNAYHQQSDDQQLDLDDDWNNGVFLSQLAAICSHGNRNEVKEVYHPSSYSLSYDLLIRSRPSLS
jgi:hypothetical protein